MKARVRLILFVLLFSGHADTQPSCIDYGISREFMGNNERFRREIDEFGPYSIWRQKNAAFNSSLENYLHSLPTNQKAFKGKDDWVFFRPSAEATISDVDWSTLENKDNPIPFLRAFQDYLKKYGIDFLVVLVPNKEEIYFDQLPQAIYPPAIEYVGPYFRKFQKEVQIAGIEIVDLLPVFLGEKHRDSLLTEPLYLRQSVHMSNRGVQLAAEVISNRIERYEWYHDIRGQLKEFSRTDTADSILGDIVSRLPQTDIKSISKREYVTAQLIRDETKQDRLRSSNAIVIVTGDSSFEIWPFIQRGVGLDCHIAYKTMLPSSNVVSWGDTPNSIKKLIGQKNAGRLNQMQLVVFTMFAWNLNTDLPSGRWSTKGVQELGGGKPKQRK